MFRCAFVPESAHMFTFSQNDDNSNDSSSKSGRLPPGVAAKRSISISRVKMENCFMVSSSPPEIDAIFGWTSSACFYAWTCFDAVL